MSNTVDNRVVNMKYNGQNFDSGTRKSAKSFDLFKKTIETGGEAISDALKSLDSKISIKGVAIAATVSRLTNAVIDAFKSMANQWVRAPMMDGFTEYETKMGALFNIFNAVKNKGSSFDDVKESINQLNDYADKTIYNFGQMTTNFQRFTTAGKSLAEAGGLVMGLSNLAASVGANNENLSRATYQMSQLSGTLKLLDYNSLVNAGMASEQFRNTIQEVSAESGRMMSKFGGKNASNSAADYFEKATKAGISFRDMVSDEVFSEADFTETMRRFSIETYASQANIDKLREEFKDLSKTDMISQDMLDKLKAVKADSGDFATEMVRVANSGKATIKTLNGVSHKAMTVDEYLKEATKQGLSFSQMAKDSKFTVEDLQKTLDRLSVARGMYDAATQIRTFSQMIATLKESIGSSWGETFENVFGDLEEATALWTGLTNAIQGIIGPMSKSRNEMLAFWNETGGREATIRGLVNIINALGDVLRPIGQAFKAVFAPLTGSDLVNASKSFEEFTAKLRPSKEVIEGIATAFYIFFNTLKLAKNVIVGVAKIIAAIFAPLKAFKPVVSQIGILFGELAANLGIVSEKGKPIISFTELLTNLLGKLSTALSFVVEKGLNAFGGGLSKLIGWLKPATDASGLTVKQLEDIAESAKQSGISIKDAASAFLETKGITGDKQATMIDKITEAVKKLDETTGQGKTSFGSWLSNWTSLLPKSFDEVMRVFEDIISFKLVKVASTVGNSVASAINALLSPIKKTRPQMIIASLAALAVSLFVLSSSIYKLSKIPFSSLTTGLSVLGIGLLMVSKFIDKFADSVKGFDAIKLKAMKGVLKSISLAIVSLSIGLRLLSSADPTKLIIGTISMLIVLSSMVKQLNKINQISKPKTSGEVLETISKAVLRIGIGLRILANANIIKMITAMMVMTGTLKSMVKIMESLGAMGSVNVKQMLLLSTSIAIIAIALRGLATAKFGNALGATILMSTVLKGLTKLFMSLQGIGNINDSIKTVVIMISALSVLIGALAILAMSDIKSVLAAGNALSKIMKTMRKIFKKVPNDAIEKAKAVQTLMNAASLLATALSTLAKSKFSSIIASAIALKIVMKSLIKMFKDVPSIVDVSGIKNMTQGLAMIAVGMALLSTQRLTGILGSAIALSKVIKVVSKAIKNIDTANTNPRSIIAFTGGIALIATGLALLSAKTLGRQLSAGIALRMVVGAMGKAMKEVDKFGVDARTIFAFTSGLTLLCLGLTVLSLNPFGKQLLSGLALAAVVFAVGGALKLASNSGVNPGAIEAFTLGLSLLAVSMAVLASTGKNSLYAALAVSAAVMALAIAFRVMAPQAANAAMISGALLMAAGAMAVMAGAMNVMAEVPTPAIVASLISFVAVLALLAASALLLGPIAPIMLTIAGAITLVGVGIAGIGAGALMGVMALEKFIYLIANAKEVFVNAANNINAVVDSLIQVANGIGRVVGVALTMLVRIVVQALLTLATELGKHVGTFASLGIQLILAFTKGILDYVDDLVEVGVLIIAQVLYGLAAAMPQLLDAAVEVILSFLAGLAQSLDEHTQDIIDIAWNVIITLVKAFVQAAASLIHNVKAIGSAIKNALLDGITGQGWENALNGLISNLDGMMKKVDFGESSITGVGEAAKDATPDVNRFSSAISGITGAVGDFRGTITGIGKKGGISSLLGLGKEQTDVIDANTLFPDGSFDGSAQGEELGETVTDGYADSVSDTSKGGKKTKAATENLVKNGVTDPLEQASKQANEMAYLFGTGVVDSVAAGLSETNSLARAMNNMGALPGYITSAAKTSKSAARNAEIKEELQALDDADQGVIKAYEEIHKAEAEAIEKKNEEIWKQTAANMSEAQYKELVEAQKTPRVALYEQSLQEMEEFSDTWYGALIGSMEEIGITATPVGKVLGVFNKGIEESANVIAAADIPNTFKSIANAFTLLGKAVPQLGSFTDAFSAFSLSLSEIGQNGASPVHTLTMALTSLGSALLDIAIDKAQQAMNAMGQIASTAASSIANIVTSAAQISVDVVVDVASWALKGGEGELPDLGDIIGSLVDSVGGATVQAGADIAGAAASGAMEMMGAGAFSGVATAITGMFGTLGQMVTSALGKLIPLVYDALRNLAKKVAPDWAITFFGSFQKIFKKFFNKLFGETLDGDDQAKWFREHGKQLGEVYVEGLSEMNGSGEQVVNETTNWLDELAAKLKSTGGLFANLAAQLIESFSTAWKSFNGWFLGIGESIVDFIIAGASGNSAVIYDYILNFIYVLTDGFFGKKADINNLGNNMLSWLLSDDGQIADGIQRLVKDIFNILTFGIFSRGDEAVLIGKLMNDRVLAGLAATPQEALVQIITSIISALLQIVGDVLPKIIVIGAQVSRAIFDGMLDFLRQGGFWKIIWAIIKGLWNGFMKSEMNIWKIGWEIAKALWEGFLVKLGIHSPSREFEASVGYMIDGLIEGAEKGRINLGKIGSDIASFLWNGFLDLFKLDTISTKISNICTDIIESIKSLIDRFNDPGKSWAEKLWDGFKGVFSITTISETIGNIVTGIKDAIKEALTKLWDAGGEMANNLWEGFKNFLGIKSPSKVFSQGGKYCIEGLAKGLGDTDAIDTAMYDLADAMKDSMSLFEDINPTITPVIDLDVIRKRAKAVQGMFGGVELSHSLASAIVDRQNGTKITSEVDKQEIGSITYQQNIYSPTPLTPRQIYRQTGTLLEIKKGKLA